MRKHRKFLLAIDLIFALNIFCSPIVRGQANLPGAKNYKFINVAALVTVAGGIVPPFQIPALLKKTFPTEIVTILDAADPYNALAKKIGNNPVWLFHGKEDEAVPITESRKISEALKKNGNKNVFYTEYENTIHNGVFLKTFTEPKLYQWLAKQKLK